MPVAVTLQQTAWKEGVLIKWASAIEDVRNSILGGRPTPRYHDHCAKNVPIGRKRIAKMNSCPVEEPHVNSLPFPIH